MREKKKDIGRWRQRADYEGILSITPSKKKAATTINTEVSDEGEEDKPAISQLFGKDGIEQDSMDKVLQEEEKAYLAQIQKDDIGLQLGLYMEKVEIY